MPAREAFRKYLVHASLHDAQRRVGIMVCGLFFRLRRNRGKGGRGKGCNGRGRKRKAETLIELVLIRKVIRERLMGP